MDEKIPVIIQSMQRKEYSFNNLDYCKKCGSYTTLKGKGCLKCNENKFISFDNMINQMCHKQNKKEILTLLNIFLVIIILGGIVFPISVKELLIALTVLITALTILIIVQQRFAERVKAFEIQKTIENEWYVIGQSLERDYKHISHLLENHDYLEAYKALRNIGTIIKKEHIKTAKIYCLNRFIIRSDMALEMDELLLPFYYQNLVAYIYEVSKYQRNLIKQPTVDYMIQSEGDIHREFINANQILGNIAGASIYSNSSLELNKEFISRYIEYIPKDRVTRIQRLLHNNTKYDWDILQQAILNMKGPSYEEL